MKIYLVTKHVRAGWHDEDDTFELLLATKSKERAEALVAEHNDYSVWLNEVTLED